MHRLEYIAEAFTAAAIISAPFWMGYAAAIAQAVWGS